MRPHDATTDVNGPHDSSPSPAQSAAELHLDCPVLLNGSVTLSCGRNLWLGGWALARAGTAAIEISVNGAPSGAVTHDVTRADIAAAFPDRDSAATSGFVAMVPSSLLPRGRHVVQVTARDEIGVMAVIQFFADVQEDFGDAPLALRDKIGSAEIALQERILSALDWHPVFCLALLVGPDEADIERARATLSSLRAQIYSAWQILIVPRRHRRDIDRLRDELIDGSANVGALRARLAGMHYGTEELRARVLAGADGIAARVASITGEGARPMAEIIDDGSRPILFGLIAAGDALSRDALGEFAMASGMERGADFFYSDEWRISLASGISEPFLKPQWSPDLLLSTNYIGRLWCATAALVARTGATLDELTRHGEYDLVLRLSEAANAIHHIPRLLCRREGERLDSDRAERQALAGALVRRGIAGAVHAGAVPGTYRVERRLVRSGLVSIVIPTCGSRGLVKTCIETLRAVTAYKEFEIVCIDNNRARDAQWRHWLSRAVQTVIETDEPFNWSRFNNLAAAQTRGEFLLFLNDDIEIIEPNWLSALLEHAERPEVGIVGALLLYPDRTIQHAGMYLCLSSEHEWGEAAFRFLREEDPGYFGLALTQRNVIAVTGACLMTRREVFERLGGFDEAHDVIANDLDYCLEAWRQGLLTVFSPYARLIHHERGSRSLDQEGYDVAAFRKKWHAAFVAGDPYHHPRFSPEHWHFAPDREAARPVCTGGPQLLREDVRSILVVKLDHIGDVVSTFPAVRCLKWYFPHARLCVLASRSTKPLWPLCGVVDEIIEFNFFATRSDAGLRPVTEAELTALRQRLLPHRFDLAVDLHRHQETRQILRYTGALCLAGFDIGGHFPWLDIAVEFASDLKGKRCRHLIDQDILNLVYAIAAACEQKRAITDLPGCDGHPWLHSLDSRLFSRRLVCIHPAAGAQTQQWPPRYFAALIDLLAEREQVNLALIGTADDREIAADILNGVQHRHAVFDLIGRIELERLPNLLRRAALFVGNDSGLHYLAAALGVPTVGIHSGVETAREWGPVGAAALAVQRDMDCTPCHLGHPAHCPRGMACLTGLLPREVYDLCRRLLVLGLARERTNRTCSPHLRTAGLSPAYGPPAFAARQSHLSKGLSKM